MTKLTDKERHALARVTINAWFLDTWRKLSETPCQSPEITRLDSYRPYGT